MLSINPNLNLTLGEWYIGYARANTSSPSTTLDSHSTNWDNNQTSYQNNVSMTDNALIYFNIDFSAKYKGSIIGTRRVESAWAISENYTSISYSKIVT